MTQATNWGVPQAADAPVGPGTVALRTQTSFDALLSSHRGTARPSYAVAGTVWNDSDTEKLHKFDGTSDSELLERVAVPASASATGREGTIAFDATHFYLCVATDTWVRASVATW